jgi:hypothetical protein
MNLLLFLFGIIFGFVETAHFGNNFLPKSNFEAWCDIASLLMVFIGYYKIRASYLMP